MLVEKKLISFDEELSELQEFMPLNFENSFFIKMFQNMFVAEETDFYNNVCLNLVFFYIYIFHCFLARLYLADDKNVELLRYLQVTEKALSKRDGSNSNIVIEKEKIDFYLFNGKEQDAINYFFHILNMNTDCVQCKKNQEIFDIRNNIAHFNLFIANKDDFDKLLENIKSNLGFISQKLYQTTKKLIIDELKEYKTIDDFNYSEVFEELNKKYYLSANDYKLIENSNYLTSIIIDTPKYYLYKYIRVLSGFEVLELEDMEEKLIELISDKFENDAYDSIEPNCYGCHVEEVYIEKIKRKDDFLHVLGTISANARLGASRADDSIHVDYSSKFESIFSCLDNDIFSFELEEIKLEKTDWIDFESDYEE